MERLRICCPEKKEINEGKLPQIVGNLKRKKQINDIIRMLFKIYLMQNAAYQKL
jgi:hypothetical protein